jgi:hypothetical protein
MLSGAQVISPEDLNKVSNGGVLNPNQMKQILSAHNKLVDQINFLQFDAKMRKEQMGQIQQTNEELTKKAPDIKQITEKAVAQELQKQKLEFDRVYEEL